jgi:SAM-dependent methyltransferase
VGESSWTCSECGHEPAVVDGFTAFAPEHAAAAPGFREELFAALAQVEAGSFWFRARSELVLWALKTYFPDCQRFMEIGCGTGFVLAGIQAANPQMELCGSEVFSAGLAFAAKRVPGARLYQMDARSIPFTAEFDVIGALDVLEHIEDDERVISEVARALRPGGGFLISVPQHPSLWSVQDKAAGHVRRYTARSLRRRIEAAGFEVVRATSFVSLLLPAMIIARRRPRSAAEFEGFDAIAELRQPKVVNDALLAIMRFETALIRQGVSLPVGGSLLMVARKPSAPEVRP